MPDPDALIFRVALPVPLRKTFDYLPPASSETVARPGSRVQVPFGARTLTGFLLSLETSSSFPTDKLKRVTRVLDTEPLLPDTILQLAQWCARYYHHPLGETLALALPAALRQGGDAGPASHQCWRLALTLDAASQQTFSRAPRQQEAFQTLQENPDGLTQDALRTMGISRQTLSALESKGLAEPYMHTPAIRDFSDHPLDPREPPLSLNSEQERALHAITADSTRFSTSLLHGITGSGKTEVYLQAIQHVLQQKRQALVLVPEIGLTPQTLSRFRARFHVPVTILHSGLTDRERLAGWESARTGEAGIIIATRSGIFTPMKHPGIIIVDEEHDQSYKQQDSIRYSARDLAIYRGHLENIPVVLGSATPSLESLHNARQHRYRYLPLTQRAGAASVPLIRLVSLRQSELKGGLSQECLNAIRSTLDQKQQVLVFLNQRGYAPTLTCDDCGWILDCPSCDAHMTLHRSPPHLCCHHCDHREPIPHHCPECKSQQMAPAGQGTERTEDILRQLFPHTDILRIDRDSTQKKNTLKTMLQQIQREEPVILIGTQMLAKGHHFPAVTLVVILNADGGFFSADFRGAEKTGQLLLQVAGRAGRATQPGQVLIQTRYPDNPLLQPLLSQGLQPLCQQPAGGTQTCISSAFWLPLPDPGRSTGLAYSRSLSC